MSATQKALVAVAVRMHADRRLVAVQLVAIAFVMAGPIACGNGNNYMFLPNLQVKTNFIERANSIQFNVIALAAADGDS